MFTFITKNIAIKRALGALLLACASVTFCSSANAGFLVLPDVTHIMGGTGEPAFLSYDTSTDTFAATGNNGAIFEPGFIDAVSDLTGTFSLTAQIDEDGAFSGGSYIWTGGSAELGIGPGSELMTGMFSLFNIDSAHYQFLGGVDTLNPLLGAEIGSIQSILWSVLVAGICPPDVNFEDNFSCDYSNAGTPAAFAVYLSPSPISAIPEPSLLSLLMLGILSIGLSRKIAGNKT